MCRTFYNLTKCVGQNDGAQIDDETRKAVDRITSQRRQAELEEQTRAKDDQKPTIQSHPDESRQDHIPESPTTAMNSERPWGEMEGDFSSRRSSLRSVSIYDIEGSPYMHAPDSPGPPPTDNPWGFEANASRRSSLSSVMPEVLVTQVPQGDDADSEDSEASEGVKKEKMSMQRLMTLLPAPTPTRFIGRMHAIVSQTDKKRKTSTSSEIPDTIKESANETDEIINTKSKKKVSSDFAMSAKLVGRFKGLNRQQGAPSDKEPDSNRSSKIGSWKRTVQKSFDRAPSPATSTGSNEVASAGGKKSNATGWRKITPKSGGPATPSPVTPTTAPASSSAKPSSTKPSGGSATKKKSFAARLSKLSKEGSFGPTANVGVHMKSLQSASMVVGRFMMAKSLKKSDDEILADFGAERDSSEDDFDTMMKQQAAAAKETEEPQPTAAEVKKSGVGKLISKAKVLSKKKSVDSGTGTPFGFGGGGASEDAQGFSIAMVSKLATFQKQTRILIAAASVSGQFASLEELTKTWMTGIPTSIRFLGRSCRFMPRGPGGIIICSSPPPPGSADPDFLNTVNMLALLSKADIKLKSSALKENVDSRSASRLSASFHGGQQLTPRPNKSRAGSRLGSASSNEGSTLIRVDDSKINNQLEAEEPTKKLVDALVIVRPASIPRWNEHKDVKEDKERDPHVFIPHHRASEVDAAEIEVSVDKRASALPQDMYATSMVLNMAVRGFKKDATNSTPATSSAS